MHLVDAPTLLSRLSHFSPVLINILSNKKNAKKRWQDIAIIAESFFKEVVNYRM
jgi:hypothetical protein